MNPFEMVVLIVAIGAVASIVRAKIGLPHRHDWGARHGRRFGFEAEREERDTRDAADAAHREEVRQLKERIAVLERIVTDQNSSGVALEREIEALRDRK